MVKAIVGPLAIVETAHVGGTSLVGFHNLLLGFFCMLREILLEPLNFAPHRGVHKDVEDSRSSEQGAGGPTPYNDAVAGLDLLLKVVAHEFHHALGIEYFRIAGCRK